MQLVKVNELIPHPRNNDFFDDVTGKRWDEFLESVKTSGVIEPIVITEGKVIVSGHQRVRACKELGIEEIMAEIKLYEGDEKKIVKDLIETNVRQRGTIGGSDTQIMARVDALKDWYGIRHGGDNTTKFANGKLASGQQEDNLPDMKLDDILKILGINRKQYDTAKRITEKTIPEVQQLIDKGNVSRRTVADLIAKLSEEDQKKLVDSLPEDVKLTAKSIEEHIQKLREGLVANTNKAMEENSRLIGEKEQLQRENNELRKGALPISKATQDKIDKLEEEKRKYYEETNRLKKETERLRGEIDKALNAKVLAEAKANGGDDAVIALENQITELQNSLEAQERKANDLEFQLEEKDDEIKELKRENKEGFMRKALRIDETPEELSQRERDALVSNIQIAIGQFQSKVEGALTQLDSFYSIDKPILKVLVETCSQAISAGTRLKVALMTASGFDDEVTGNEDYDLDDSGLELTLGA